MINRIDIQKMTRLGIFTAIIFLMLVSGLGMIQPVFPFSPKVTTLHIPVIIGACLMGWKSGAFLGGMFGLASFINNSFIAPGPFSFVFTPFYTAPSDFAGNGNDIAFGGNFGSLIICFVPRIMVGLIAGLVFKYIMRINSAKKLPSAGMIGIAGGVAGLLGAATNTVLVMSGISLFFGNAYSVGYSILNDAPFTMADIIRTTVLSNGIAEAIVAALLSAAIVVPLTKIDLLGN
ncbi:MAG: ECF transporter S component [Oscillospiraceae bacterium]|nr:ECF transporter S component [Oscillospiraceae bacterium]